MSYRAAVARAHADAPEPTLAGGRAGNRLVPIAARHPDQRELAKSGRYAQRVQAFLRRGVPNARRGRRVPSFGRLSPPAGCVHTGDRLREYQVKSSNIESVIGPGYTVRLICAPSVRECSTIAWQFSAQVVSSASRSALGARFPSIESCARWVCAVAEEPMASPSAAAPQAARRQRPAVRYCLIGGAGANSALASRRREASDFGHYGHRTARCPGRHDAPMAPWRSKIVWLMRNAQNPPSGSSGSSPTTSRESPRFWALRFRISAPISIGGFQRTRRNGTVALSW